jgi:hypothetical protein
LEVVKMADESQVIYEYTNGNTVEFKTDDLTIEIRRPLLKIYVLPDKKIKISDPAAYQRIFSCTSNISGADLKELHDVQIGAITYGAGFPRLQKVRFDGGGVNEITNIEVALTSLKVTDVGAGRWDVAVTFTEITD